MEPLTEDSATYARTRLACKEWDRPTGLECEEELGRGANNRAYVAAWHGQACVLRVPRRRSDTQQRDSAIWEAIHSLEAARCGAGPLVYHASHVRHANDLGPSGLYLITERFDTTLEDLLEDRSRRAQLLAGDLADDLARETVECIARLARHRLLVFDLKPSNVVVTVGEERNKVSSPRVRIIDFGRDFCEWKRSGMADLAPSTPLIDLAEHLVERMHDAPSERADALTLVLHATMLCQLAATTTQVLHNDRRRTRMDRAAREAVHGLAREVCALLDSMQGRHIGVVRALLRSDGVRGVLQHYHGRRNAGTARTLRLARGQEL